MKVLGTLLFIFLLTGTMAKSQQLNEFRTIREANENPENTLRLTIVEPEKLGNIDWLKYKNLKYLSLKNLHLKEIPKEIGSLTNLKVLDLSGNDFEVLPPSFIKLNDLEELFLNDEKNIDLSKNVDLISKMNNLKILHIENDKLKKLPNNFWKLNHLESIYLNGNQLKEFTLPKEKMNNIKNIYLNNNLFVPSDIQRLNSKYGTILRF
ncbi:leucine-rich repeat domain-containing protein [Chryseobacterium sp. RU33C]|uniref:leucine-rich repeat domain-containing protein n=1 Tax=Chryseobacterium sp. RU33C TaxID=1907398 RepID=UPI000953CD74|nr:leucine-rich repeat domain-containing protein [Chryseobacterium sp. RU33C]SIQ06665.1 Leucine rich repeat-containing protein [Chryseobacterium sp. RU33C]